MGELRFPLPAYAIYEKEFEAKNSVFRTRLNPDEISHVNAQPNWFLKRVRAAQLFMSQIVGRDWKSQKYRRGNLVGKDVTQFFS